MDAYQVALLLENPAKSRTKTRTRRRRGQCGGFFTRVLYAASAWFTPWCAMAVASGTQCRAPCPYGPFGPSPARKSQIHVECRRAEL